MKTRAFVFVAASAALLASCGGAAPAPSADSAAAPVAEPPPAAATVSPEAVTRPRAAKPRPRGAARAAAPHDLSAQDFQFAKSAALEIQRPLAAALRKMSAMSGSETGDLAYDGTFGYRTLSQDDYGTVRAVGVEYRYSYRFLADGQTGSIRCLAAAALPDGQTGSVAFSATMDRETLEFGVESQQGSPAAALHAVRGLLGGLVSEGEIAKAFAGGGRRTVRTGTQDRPGPMPTPGGLVAWSAQQSLEQLQREDYLLAEYAAEGLEENARFVTLLETEPARVPVSKGIDGALALGRNPAYEDLAPVGAPGVLAEGWDGARLEPSGSGSWTYSLQGPSGVLGIGYRPGAGPVSARIFHGHESNVLSGSWDGRNVAFSYVTASGATYAGSGVATEATGKVAAAGKDAGARATWSPDRLSAEFWAPGEGEPAFRAWLTAQRPAPGPTGLKKR